MLLSSMKETANLLQFQKVFAPNINVDPEGVKKTTAGEGKIMEKDLSNVESIKDFWITNN